MHIGELGVGWVAFSGHELYAPFGAGVLAGRADWLQQTEPYLAGTVKELVRDGARWSYRTEDGRCVPDRGAWVADSGSSAN